MILLDAIFAIVISIYDLKYHRIPNSILLAFTLTSLSLQIYLSQITMTNLALGFIFLIFSLALARVADMGSGDVKLLTVCALFIIPPTRLEVSNFLLTFCVCVLIQLIIHFLCKKTVSGYLPIGPSILVSAIWCASRA